MNEKQNSSEEVVSESPGRSGSTAVPGGGDGGDGAAEQGVPATFEASEKLSSFGGIGEGDNPGSVSMLISRVKEGDEDSVRLLWNRYSDALVRSAQSRLSKQTAAKVDSEELAQSVFFAIYKGAVEDKFERLDDRAGFWTLVLAITRRKAVDRIRKVTAAKRGGVAALNATRGNVEGSAESFVSRLPSRELDPQTEVECNDLLEKLKAQLDAEDPSGTLTRVALARIAGVSVKEIAVDLGRTERTVERKLNLVRSVWAEAFE